MMNRKVRILALAVAIACGALALETDPDDAIYCTTLKSNFDPYSAASTSFADKYGNPTNWVQGSYLIINDYTGNRSLTSAYAVRGVRWDTSGYKHIDGGACMSIGEAGLELTKGGYELIFGRSVSEKRMQLTADQVWKCSASTMSFVALSDDNHERYQRAYIGADATVHSWTIRDNLTVWLPATNYLASVDVRVEDPARLRLVTKIISGWTGDVCDGCLNARSLTLSGDAEMWKAGGTLQNMANGYSTQQTRLDSFSVAPLVVLEGGADMRLIGATWAIPTLRVTGTGATSSLRGSCTFIRESSAIELQDGATLELPATNLESGVSAGFSVTGTGTLKVASSVWELTGSLALGDDVELLFGAGIINSPISGGKRYVVDPGAGNECLVFGNVTETEVEKIEILSGTCRMPSMSHVPAGMTFEVADGAALVFSSAAGYDASRVTLIGSGTCGIDVMCVTDDIVTSDEIVVNADEVLRIFGNGLTAATRVKLAGGTMRFERNGVTVASPILVTDNSIIESMSEAVTGTVAGVVASTNVATGSSSMVIPKLYKSGTATVNVRGLWVLGPGTVIFSGGGVFSSGDGDRMELTRGARVHLTGGTYRFEVQQTSSDYAPIHTRELVGGEKSMNGVGRYLCVRDGGELQFASRSSGSVQPKIFIVGPKDAAEYDATTMIPVFEIGQGGTVTLPVNSRIYLGYTDNRVQLKITGGTLNLETTTSMLIFGGPGALTSCGEIYLESGTISTGCSLMRTTSNQNYNRFARGRFIWSGGTLKLNSNFQEPNIFDMPSSCYSDSNPQQSGMLRISTRLIGENCVLDLSDLQADSVTNVPAALDEAEWYGHGTLTVKGGKELVMNSVPDGFSLKLEGEGTRVKVAEGAYVYDYDTCYQYKDWKGYDGGNSYSVTNTALPALSVAAYTLAGTNCGFSVARADLPVTVTNTTVVAGGDWNGAVALAAAGSLEAQNLTFETGSLLSVPYAGGETVGGHAGRVTLPAAMDVRAVPAAGATLSGTTVFTAAEGVTGSPVWNMLTGRFKVFADGSRVWIVPKGTMLTVR